MTRQMSPQEQARLEAMKRSWQQRREITNRLSRIRNKIGVYSGKGGVGKTTVAVNLAVTLAQKGYAVGLMDTDIDCPNASRVLGATEKPTMQDDMLIPPVQYGVKIISMTFFQQNEEEAIIWRGPMVHNAINQFLQTTDWGDLDCLVVDLPPGTSDAPAHGDASAQPGRLRGGHLAAGAGQAGRQALHQHDPQAEGQRAGRGRELQRRRVRQRRGRGACSGDGDCRSWAGWTSGPTTGTRPSQPSSQARSWPRSTRAWPWH